MKRALVVDDDAGTRQLLRFVLEAAGFECVESTDIQEAYWLITDQPPDIVLLEWVLPGGSGLELLARLRKEETTASLPVIMLTTKADEEDVIQGLDFGANDYVTKPFSSRELLARIRAVFRHNVRQAESSKDRAELRAGELVLQIDSRRVMLSSKVLEIGPTEFKLLHVLMAHPEKALSRDQLVGRVWRTNSCVRKRTIDVHIRRLRKLLQTENPAYSDLIQTVRGTGYRFSPRDLLSPDSSREMGIQSSMSA
jgi:two-component system phosphate regulon response regulator PhoB